MTTVDDAVGSLSLQRTVVGKYTQHILASLSMKSYNFTLSLLNQLTYSSSEERRKKDSCIRRHVTNITPFGD